MRTILEIEVQPCWREHRVEGRAVLPGVEAMALLSETAQPADGPAAMADISFPSFLEIADGKAALEVIIETGPQTNGSLPARLLTRKVSKGGISREREHCRVTFVSTSETAALPFDLAAVPEGICSRISSDRLYSDYVPMGSAYRNAGDVHISPDGAVAVVKAPAIQAELGGLGSPFPLDAAMHCACAWGQIFAGIIAYPVAFEKRVVPRPTLPGSEYFCRVSPLGENRGGVSFDIRIYDARGNLCDAVFGMLMKPIAGAERPACRAGNPGPGLFDALRADCRAFSVIELGAVLPFSLKALTAAEMGLSRGFGPKRLQSFSAGRLAFKRVWRRVAQDYERAADAIPDFTTDGLPGDGGEIFYSISHDKRFAFAAAGKTRTGADVENISDRVAKNRRIFLNDGDNTAMDSPSGLDQLQKLLRVWSAKEALSKATGNNVAELWKKMSATVIGNKRTALRFEGRSYSVVHGQAEGHLFTVTAADQEY